MQTTKILPATAALALAVFGIATGLTSRIDATDAPAGDRTPVATAVANAAAPAVAAVAGMNPAAAAAATVRSAAATQTAIAADAVRAQIKYETVKWAGKHVQTLDEQSRILLARAAAERAGLTAVGLGFRDVYGLIEAETSWIQRTGASKNGTPNLGLAQFEPKTAAALGLTDPEDPVQAVFAAAAHMKDAARWAAGRIGGLKLSGEQYTAKLREGVSVYYNLSVKGRSKWDGTNTAQLPVETQRHIANVASGVREAEQLARNMNA